MNKKMKKQKTILPGALGVRVVKTKQHPKGDINFALRAFKKDLKESGKMQDLRDRRYHEPESMKRREKMKRAKFFQKINSQEH